MFKSKTLNVLIVLFVAIFFIGLAVIAIIISRGGTITDNGFVLESGVIRVQTEPQEIEAKFYINNEEIKLSDKRINGLEAGAYVLRIESPGYATWEKNIIVSLGYVQEIYARLYPTTFSIEAITKTDIDRAFFSNNGEYVFYVVKNSEFGTENGIWKLRLTQNQFLFGPTTNTPVKLSNITSQIQKAIKSGKYEIIPSPDNNRFLLRDTDTQGIYVMDGNNFNDISAENLTETFGFVPDETYWFNGSSSLVVSHGSLLFEHNLSSKVDTIIRYHPEKKAVYSVNNSSVYLFNELDSKLLVYQSQTLKPVNLLNIRLPKTLTELHTPISSSRFVIFKDLETYYYLDTEKSLLKEIGKDLEFHSFAQDGRSAIFLKDKTVYTYTVKELVATNTVETKLNQTGLILNTNSDIAKFIPQSSHILFYANGEKHLIQVAEKEGTNLVTLLDNDGIKNADFSYNSDGTKFFVLLKDEVQGENSNKTARSNLYSIDLEKPAN